MLKVDRIERRGVVEIAKWQLGSKSSWSCYKLTASSLFRVPGCWWLVPSQTAVEQFVSFISVFLLIKSFDLVAKPRAAPELASEADVPAMLLNSQEHNSILGLSFRWPGSILHISG